MGNVKRLVKLIRAFLEGNTSMSHVSEIEGEFARLLDNNERFSDLQYALAMYQGESESHRYEFEHLRIECAWAIEELERETR